MIKEQGKIEEIHKQTAMVRIRRRSACAHCQSRGSCSIAERDMVIEVPNDLQAGVGDEVEVSMPEGTLLRLSALIYMLPVIALLVGAFFGAVLGEALQTNTSLTAIVLGGGFMAVSFYGLILYDRKKRKGNGYCPRMTKVLVHSHP